MTDELAHSNLVTADQAIDAPATGSMMDPSRFDHMVRVAKMLSLSPLFPDSLKKQGRDAAVANGVLVLNMAERLREDPLTVAQNIYFVGGKPGWSASYMISKANSFGIFKDPIDWHVAGNGDDLSVTAFATVASTGRRVEATATMKMAKAEGWAKNQKYNTMPELMLRYRAATMLIRLYCPEVMVGVPIAVDLDRGDYKDVTPAEDDAAKRVIDTLDAEVVDASPKRKVDRTPPAPTAEDDNDHFGPQPIDSQTNPDLLAEIETALRDGVSAEAARKHFADAIDNAGPEVREAAIAVIQGSA